MFSVNTQQKGLEKKKRWHAFCYLSFENEYRKGVSEK